MEQMITLTFEMEREGDQYVSTCRELDVSSYGDSVEDAARRLDDAVRLYLDVLAEDGELERVFRERGIHITERLEANCRVDVPSGVFSTVKRVPIGAS